MKTIHQWHTQLSHSPFHSLLTQNAFFELLQSGNTISLLHITTQLKQVIESKELLASNGCLVGSTYCVPLSFRGNKWQVHNLGSYIYKHETIRCLASKGLSGKAEMLIINVALPADSSNIAFGINYLKLGDTHYNAYLSLHNMLPSGHKKLLQKNIEARITHTYPLFQLSYKIVQGKHVDNDQFFALLTKSVNYLPILGYIYFEAMVEYVMLFSQDDESIRLAGQGELNCRGYKELAFKLRPSLLRNFNLGHFSPTLRELARVTNEFISEGTVHLSVKDFIEHVKYRFCSLVVECLFAGQSLPSLNKQPLFDVLTRANTTVLGHAIDRELRNRNLYDDFHRTFDAYKARQVWQYWKRNRVIIPFNGLLPKGEVGINPLYIPSGYAVYKATPFECGKDLYVEKGRQLDIQIVPHLVNPMHGFMGAIN